MAEDDAGTVVKPDVGSANLGYRPFADDMFQRRLQLRECFGYVHLVPIALHRLTTGFVDEHRQVGFVRHFLQHLSAAAQQVVLWPCVEG